jgi:hypothetical protein
MALALQSLAVVNPDRGLSQIQEAMVAQDSLAHPPISSQTQPTAINVPRLQN